MNVVKNNTEFGKDTIAEALKKAGIQVEKTLKEQSINSGDNSYLKKQKKTNSNIKKSLKDINPSIDFTREYEGVGSYIIILPKGRCLSLSIII